MQPHAHSRTLTATITTTVTTTPALIARLRTASVLLAQCCHGPAVRATRHDHDHDHAHASPSACASADCGLPYRVHAPCLAPSWPGSQSDAIEGRGRGCSAALQRTDRPCRQTKNEGPRCRRITSRAPRWALSDTGRDRRLLTTDAYSKPSLPHDRCSVSNPQLPCHRAAHHVQARILFRCQGRLRQ
jgi:hypothetical protein